jgi:hypothetical protein
MASFDFTEVVDAQDLARFDEQFRALGTGDSAFPEVPDGNYDVLVEDAQLERSQSSGNPMLVWKLRIQGPAHSHRVLWKRRSITENTLTFVKEDLEACGVELERLSDLPTEVRSMIGIPMRALKRSKEGRYNVYFVRDRAAADREDHGTPF